MSDLLLDGWMLLLGATAAVMVVYHQESFNRYVRFESIGLDQFVLGSEQQGQQQQERARATI